MIGSKRENISDVINVESRIDFTLLDPRATESDL